MPLTATINLGPTGAGSMSIGNSLRPIRGTDLDDARSKVRSILTTRAVDLDELIIASCTEPEGAFTIAIHPDGTVTAADLDEQKTAPHPSPEPAPAPPRTPIVNTPDQLATIDDKARDADDPVHPTTRRERQAELRQRTLLEQISNEAPARTGVRGLLNTLGLHLAPSNRERTERDDVAAVSQHWPGPRTIAVVNGKGGAAKTPTTILLSAVLARNGGAGVIAWDNNPSRGTLGWRTQTGPHDATVIDLLPHVDHLLSPHAQAAEMAGYTHHQRQDRYDVLRSRPEILSAHPGDDTTFNRVHDVLARYYRVIIVDSGNDETTLSWRAMIARADAIVVPTITRPEHAESARLLLDELAGADPHSATLAENALVIVSQGSKAEPGPDQLVNTFRQITRAAVGIPYDPAMAGRPLILDNLAPTTRRAWLAASAALAHTLT
ncbi:MinD/ParA family ATP-binding protein [Actinomyces howellii]|uniref:Flp pilus assembly protein, ATPase CpaE n=1 Tax=Actinomyces howellii TaxID=52771 RepID=A0A3S4R537_9ACTO|nr:AAA family ATPase [Actinomyces howellii]VEG29993.1 Flp pilus assembly protein, ATPase CpaE [Actinomyces howellii]